MLKRTFKVIDRSFGFVEDWSLFLTVLIALLTAFANIILRKASSQSLYWSDEVVRKVIYFSTYIGASAAIRQRSLIRIDAVPQLFRLTKKPLSIIGHVAMLVFGGMLVWLGWKMTYLVYQDPFAKTTILQIPEWYLYAVLPILGVMSIFRTIIVMVEDWQESDDKNS